MALPKKPKILKDALVNKKQKITRLTGVDPKFIVHDDNGSELDIRVLQDSDEYIKDGVRYLIDNGKHRRIGKGSKVLKRIPKSEYDEEGNPILMVEDIDDINLSLEVDEYFS